MSNSLRQLVFAALRRIIPTGSVAEQATKSSIWVAVMNISERGLQVLTMIVLARLLDPSEFGLFGIALLTLSAIQGFTEIGVSAALIQQKEDNVDSYLNTVWILEIARGTTIATALLLAAPFVASFFGEPRATEPLRVIALTPLLLGMRNPGIVYFQKGLQFHKEFVYRLSGSVAIPIVAIGYALITPSVWALIFGFVAADVVRLLASYLTHSYRPRLEFDVSSAKELIDYGIWITGSSVLNFLSTEGDDAVVGWLLSASPLAFYQLAYRFANAPATEISQTIARVAFPMYSKVQEDRKLLQESFFRTLQVTAVVAFPLAFGIAAVTPTFIEAFLGQKWLPMVTTMQILAMYGLLRALGKVYGSVWMAIGRPDYLTKLPLVRIVLMAIFIYPATVTFGIEGAALVVTGISLFPMLPLNIYVIVDSVETTYRRLLRELTYPLVASIAMWAAVWFMRESMPIESMVIEFFVLVGVGAVTYVIAVILLDVVFGWGVIKNAQSIRQSL